MFRSSSIKGFNSAFNLGATGGTSGFGISLVGVLLRSLSPVSSSGWVGGGGGGGGR